MSMDAHDWQHHRVRDNAARKEYDHSEENQGSMDMLMRGYLQRELLRMRHEHHEHLRLRQQVLSTLVCAPWRSFDSLEGRCLPAADVRMNAYQRLWGRDLWG
jgi:hypothetical protein